MVATRLLDPPAPGCGPSWSHVQLLLLQRCTPEVGAIIRQGGQGLDYFRGAHPCAIGQGGQGTLEEEVLGLGGGQCHRGNLVELQL